MSFWTSINGIITVSPMGRTQAEKTYILQTVLDHLPVVNGSERDMNVYMIQKNGGSSISSCDEFGFDTNNLIDDYGQKSRNYGWLRCQDEDILVVNGDFRDRMFDETLSEFNKWLCRLAKRISIEDIMVKIKGYDKELLIDNSEPYKQMFESPSWLEEGTENWCEYLMWTKGE